MGGGAGVLLATWAMGLIARRSAGLVPGWTVYEVDGRIVAVAVVLTVLTAIACGGLPLLGAWRLHPAHVLGRSSGGAGRGRHRRHDLLLAAQVAVGILLVGGAATAVRTFVRVSDLDTLGHRWEGLTTVSVNLPEGRLHATGDRGDLADALRERFGRVEGVGRVAASAALFLGSWGAPDAPSPVRAQGAAEPVPNRRVPRHSLTVGSGWLELMEIPVKAGRFFTEADRRGAPPVAVVSESAARVLWPDAEPQQALGRNIMIRLDGEERAFATVGVAGDVVIDPRREDRTVSPRIYLSLHQTPEALMPGTRGVEMMLEAPETIPSGSWVGAAADVDSEATVAYAQPLSRSLANWNTSIRRTAGSMSGVGALALGILLLGVYGTMSYRVASTRYELGIRVALGARPPEIVRSVVVDVGRVFTVAVAVGLVLSVVGARLLDGGGIPVGTSDVGLLAVSAVLLMLAGTAGCLAPVRRALAVDPMDCLRAGD